MCANDDGAAQFFRNYSETVGAISLRLREIILATIPEIEETVDRASRVIGYGFGPGYAGVICTIIPSKKGVKLGIVRGAEFADRFDFLEGAGARHRYVSFQLVTDIDANALARLFRAAFSAWQKRAR